MRILTYKAGGSARRMRLPLRQIAAHPAPFLRGLHSRHWRIDQGAVRGRYLFEDQSSLEAFAREPELDPAFRRIEDVTGAVPVEAKLNEGIVSFDVLERPIFIISAPRAGSTLLYELLAKSGEVWTIDGESEGVIEGIPSLHPANRGFVSHRLTDEDVNDETARSIRAGFIAELRDRRGHRYLELTAAEKPSSVRLLEKTPENSLRVAFLAAVFPSALFVFLHRDARQSVSSILEAWHHEGFINIPTLPDWRLGSWHLLLPEGWQELKSASLLEVAAFQWAAANHRALEDLEALPRDRWISVEYAQLVAAPELVVRRVCEFAEIPLDEHLTRALARPIPLSSTTISPPSPIKWRSNPEFSETALERHTLIMGRLRDLGRVSAPPPPPRDWTVPVRFSCFLDQISAAAVTNRSDWIVAPSFRFQIGATLPLGLLHRTRFRDRFLTDFPLLWVEDPGTHVLYPFWARRGQAALFRQFAAKRPPPAQLSDGLAGQLVEAGILVTADSLECRCREGDALVERTRPLFEDRRYCALPALIHQAHVAALGRYYRELIDFGNWAAGDEQVPLRYGQHNETMSRYFHHQLADLVGRVSGEPVKPAYAYVSAYREGAVLRPHVDRKQCVFTLSLWIEDGTEPSTDRWPLWFETHSGKVAITQKAGDAVLFRGCELPHWRDRPLPGSSSTTLLFHYVPRDFVGVLD